MCLLSYFILSCLRVFIHRVQEYICCIDPVEICSKAFLALLQRRQSLKSTLVVMETPYLQMGPNMFTTSRVTRIDGSENFVLSYQTLSMRFNKCMMICLCLLKTIHMCIDVTRIHGNICFINEGRGSHVRWRGWQNYQGKWRKWIKLMSYKCYISSL